MSQISSAAPRSTKRNSNQSNRPTAETKLTPLLRDSARLLVIGAMFVAVWGIGGYYPVTRFVVLALLVTATITACFSGICSRASIKSALPLTIVMILALLYGMLQLVPFEQIGIELSTGIQEIRASYGAPDNSSQTLVAWMTQDWLAMAVIALAGYVLSACLFNDNGSRIMLLAAIALCGIAQVFWGIVQLSTAPYTVFWGFDVPTSASVPFGTFLNRNHACDFLGMSLACCVGLARWRYAEDTQRWHSGYEMSGHLRAIIANPLTLAIWLGVFWLLLGWVLSFSRGGWAAGLVAILLLPMCWKRSGKRRSAFFIIGSFLVLASTYAAVQLFGFGDRINTRMDDLELNNVMSDSRFAHWSEAMPAVQHYLPFGSGLGTYGHAYLPFDPTPGRGWFTHAHNQYLEILMEAGIPGILLVLIGLYIAIRSCVRICGSDRSVSKQALGIAALAAVLMQAFHAITDFGLMMPGNSITLFVLIGAATAASSEKRSTKFRRSRRKVRQASIQGEAAAPESSQSNTAKRPKDSESPIWSTLVTVAVNTLLLAAVCGALWQQGRHAKASKLMADTSFTPATPSPTVETADLRIEKLEAAMGRWPEYEPMMRRLIQLRMHRAQRETYDEIRRAQAEAGVPVNPIATWDGTSLESIVVKLFDASPNALSEEEKQGVIEIMQTETHLAAAWEELNDSLALNPVQPRTHLRMAQLGAASGRPWEQSYELSKKLAVVDAKHSLGNGLLAWAAGDKASMISQWRRTLGTDWAPMKLVYRLAAMRISEDEIVDQMMPDRWVVPFRLSQWMRDQESSHDVRIRLLERSSEIAQNTIIDDFSLHRTLGIIASTKGDSATSAEHFEKAIQLDPRNTEVRHLASVQLYKSGKVKQAITHSRVATMLAPKNTKYRNYHSRLLKLHRRQHFTRPSNQE